MQISWLKSSIVWKLTIWFLLLSFLPLAVMTIFIRQTVSDTFDQLAADDALSQARLLAHEISASSEAGQVLAILADSVDDTQLAFLVSATGRYMAHSNGGKAGGSVLNDFPAEVAEKLAAGGGEGTLIDPAAGGFISYVAVPDGAATAVLVVDGSAASAPMRRIERSAIIQLSVSLALIVAAGSAAIWFVFKPIQRLTKAAEEVGAGNLDVQIDPSDMEGELEVLTLAFNQMTRQVQGAYDELEQRVEERTEELREADQLLRAIVDGSPLPIGVIDGNGKIRIWNPAAQTTFGWTEQEVLDRSDPVIAPEDDWQEAREYRHRVLAGESISGEEIIRRKKDGSPVELETWAAPLRDAGGEISGAIFMFADLSSRKRAEEALFQQNRESAVLGERNRMAREIHDTLAQGFTGIVLQLEAGEQAMETNPSEVAGHLERAKNLARESLQEARRTVWDLLPRALEGVSLEEALREEINRFPVEIHEKASFKSMGASRDLSSDVRTALLRLCQESLTNIRKHSGATEVTVTLTYNPHSVALEVTDNGGGFDVNESDGGGEDGGFGLIGMEQRVRALGGELTVTSHLGQGAKVAVKIPDA